MKKILLLFLLTTNTFYAQTTISGRVVDTNTLPIMGANIYLEGTYDGTSTDENGAFSFETEEAGVQTLVVSFLSYETYQLALDISKLKNLSITLKEEVNALNSVVLSAGTFEAGDNAKVSVLNPLDVVTTASALGDFVGALQTLPGTATVAEDGRLFVRGGEADETQIFIDGVRVFTPFTPTTNNIPTRGRYSPFLFKGITFSTGGYSAEYGQALSSVLLLNTIDEPDQEKTDISLMSVGGGVGHTKKWEKSSLSINTSYINLAPYLEVFKDRNDWKKPFEGMAGEAVYRHKVNNGLVKLYAAFDHTNFELVQDDINLSDGFRFGLSNKNFYLNSSYKGFFEGDWVWSSGVGFTMDHTDVNIQDGKVDDTQHSFHFKSKLKKSFSNRFKLQFGAEYFITDFTEDFRDSQTDFRTSFNNNIAATFVESDIFFSNDLAAKVGVRASYSELLQDFTVSPRLSLAYKTGEDAQISMAYGNFYQTPRNEYLKFYNDFSSERAEHFLLNYQYSKDGRIFRAETYYKKYDDLVKFDTQFAGPEANFSSTGDGFAKGLDVFWRDSKSFQYLDYWVSYSYLDTERNYQNFPESAAPAFTSKHNLSLVGKYWVDKWRSQLGISYSFATGRPYTNPNTSDFLGDRTKTYNSVSFNWAYLISQQKILYFSINNVLGTRNVFGYNYANTPNANGVFDRQAIRPAADQFFFVGFFWTISDDKKSNQLDNL